MGIASLLRSVSARPTAFSLLLILMAAGCSDSSRQVEAPAGQQARFDSLFAAAEEVYYSGAYDQARTLLSDILSEADTLAKVAPADRVALAARARATTWMGLAAWRLGEYAHARKLLEEALAIELANDLNDQLFRTYNGLGLLAWNENRLTAARDWYLKASSAAESQGNRLEAATARGNLALVQTELGEFAEAREGFRFMRKEAAALGETRIEGNALTNLGMLEIRVGNPRAAIPHLREARARYDSVSYPTGVLSVLGQMGTAYTAMGEAKMAFVALDSALAMARGQGLRQEEASDLEALAEIYRDAGDVQRALTLYDEARGINDELSLSVETGADLRGEAEIQANLGDLFAAHALAEQALGLHREAGARLDELYDLLTLAEIQAEMQATQAVRSTLFSARTLADELDARAARTALALTEARIADKGEDPRTVLEATSEAARDVARGGFASEWEVFLLRSRAFADLGQVDSAIAAGHRALSAVERVRKSFGSEMLRAAYVSDRREVYSHLVTVLLGEGRVAEAFEVSDAARGRTLVETIAETGESPAAETATAYRDAEKILWQIDQLIESIDYLEGFPPEERSDDQNDELEGLYEKVAQLRNTHEELVVRLAEAGTPAAALLGGTKTSAAAVQSSLGTDQLLLELFVAPGGPVRVFAVRPSGVREFRTPLSPENLASRIRIARDLIASQEDRDGRAREILSGLFDALVRPVLEGWEDLERPSEILVVPHGETAYLPFAALYDSRSGRYLAQEYTLGVLPSAAALPALRRREAEAESPPAAAAALAPFPDELPGTVEEVKAVSRGVPRTREYVGREATEDRLRQVLGTPEAVHLATHGILDPRNPLFSRLELADGAGIPEDDGRLEVHELLGVSISAPVVFLSGCNTGMSGYGVGGLTSGADYATLSQAFLFAGADNVIATLWPVEDAGAAAFASEFYRALDLEKRSPAQALAQAQRAMLRGLESEWARPFYWAAYQLIGSDFSESVQSRAQDSDLGSVQPQQRSWSP